MKTTTNKYILYIDDDADDRENFGYALEKCKSGVNLRTAEGADDALKKLAEQTKPCCIYLDINMPKVNGLEFLKILKSNIHFASIPVIMFSTAMGTKSEKEAMSLGAAEVFAKPSLLQGLIDHLRISISTHF